MNIIITKTSKETQKVGEEFATKIKNGGVVCLYGNLGAGKTTLTQGIARGLGIKQNLVSPTFILMRRYELKRTADSRQQREKYLYHIDLYRLNDMEEIKGLGIEEIVSDPKNIVLIEWPGKIESTLPRRRWEIKMETVSENERKIEINELK